MAKLLIISSVSKLNPLRRPMLGYIDYLAPLSFTIGKSFSQVAKCSATSKEEWEDQCKLWPTSYHPSNEYVDVTLLILLTCIILKYTKL
jgi:hypothetical protein